MTMRIITERIRTIGKLTEMTKAGRTTPPHKTTQEAIVVRMIEHTISKETREGMRKSLHGTMAVNDGAQRGIVALITKRETSKTWWQPSPSSVKKRVTVPRSL
jgi:hypothetical protein